MVIIIGALYVLVPAIVTLAMVLYASWCPVTIEEEGSAVLESVMLQLGAITERKAIIAAQSAAYWERCMQLAVTQEARVKAKAYAKMWRTEWHRLNQRACGYRQV